mgnify:CR=1 FL=1
MVKNGPVVVERRGIRAAERVRLETDVRRRVVGVQAQKPHPPRRKQVVEGRLGRFLAVLISLPFLSYHRQAAVFGDVTDNLKVPEFVQPLKGREDDGIHQAQDQVEGYNENRSDARFPHGSVLMV